MKQKKKLEKNGIEENESWAEWNAVEWACAVESSDCSSSQLFRPRDSAPNPQRSPMELTYAGHWRLLYASPCRMSRNTFLAILIHGYHAGLGCRPQIFIFG